MEEIYVSQREIMLVPFPFSDFSGKKVRPVIVISNELYNKKSEDVIVCGITSNISKQSYSIEIDNRDLEEGRLFNPCCIKVENVLKINKRLLIKKIARVKENTYSKVKKKFNIIID